MSVQLLFEGSPLRNFLIPFIFLSKYHTGKAPEGNYQAIIEVARAIVLVLGLSVLFAFVHLILAFSEDVTAESQGEIIQENKDKQNESLLNEESELTQRTATKNKKCNE